jgi:hypothetical protein
MFMDEKRLLLRHFLAALAYRTQKALHDAPAYFFSFCPAPMRPTATPHSFPLDDECADRQSGRVRRAAELRERPRLDRHPQ